MNLNVALMLESMENVEGSREEHGEKTELGSPAQREGKTRSRQQSTGGIYTHEVIRESRDSRGEQVNSM